MLKIIGALLLAYLLVVAVMFIWQRRFIYRPANAEPQQQAWQLPALQSITLHPEKNLTLKSWYHQAKPGKPTLLYFHGNVGNINYRMQAITPFIKQGYGALLLSYRGYSRNPGKSTEAGLYNDGRAAMAFLTQQQKIPNQCILLYGESLGTGVAVQMATEYDVGALVLLSPFTDLASIAQTQYPYLPVRWLLLDKFDSQAKIAHVNTPLLIIHGRQDTVIPLKFGQQLFDAATQPKKMLIAEGFGHSQFLTPKMLAWVNDFMQQHCR